MAAAPCNEASVDFRLKAELLLRRCLPPSYLSAFREKKLTLEAVIGVLGVLLAARLGGGVVLRSPTSAEGAGKEEILLLNGVPRGSRLRGGSRIGCRFFLLLCTDGLFSASDPAPTVSPLLCLIVAFPFFAESVSLVCVLSEEREAISSDVVRSGDGLRAALDLNADAEKEKVLLSGSFGDS
jgi:hypothetical protein